jgi:hypothetical protein
VENFDFGGIQGLPVPEITNEEKQCSLRSQDAFKARYARPKGMRPDGLRKGRNILPEPWKKIATTLAMRSRVSASLQSPTGTASPPLSALAALLCCRHVGSGRMSDSHLTRRIDGGAKPSYDISLQSFIAKSRPFRGGPSHVCGHRLLSLYRISMLTSHRSPVQALSHVF